MTIILYGIPNCDTVKKARVWLDSAQIGYAFHNYKQIGVDADRLRSWCQAAGWEQLLNRAGTTFRKLAEADRAGLVEAKAIAVMLANPSCIKRPVLEFPGGLLIGFKQAEWAEQLT